MRGEGIRKGGVRARGGYGNEGRSEEGMDGEKVVAVEVEK